jgi:hypothetical protein
VQILSPNRLFKRTRTANAGTIEPDPATIAVEASATFKDKIGTIFGRGRNRRYNLSHVEATVTVKSTDQDLTCNEAGSMVEQSTPSAAAASMTARNRSPPNDNDRRPPPLSLSKVRPALIKPAINDDDHDEDKENKPAIDGDLLRSALGVNSPRHRMIPPPSSTPPRAHNSMSIITVERKTREYGSRGEMLVLNESRTIIPRRTDINAVVGKKNSQHNNKEMISTEEVAVASIEINNPQTPPRTTMASDVIASDAIGKIQSSHATDEKVVEEPINTAKIGETKKTIEHDQPNDDVPPPPTTTATETTHNDMKRHQQNLCSFEDEGDEGSSRLAHRSVAETAQSSFESVSFDQASTYEEPRLGLFCGCI